MMLIIIALAAGAAGGWFINRYHITRNYDLTKKVRK